MTRKTLTSALVALILATFTPIALAVSADADRSAAQKKALASYGSDVNIVMGERDVPSYLMGRLSPLASGEPREAAEAALDQNGAAFRRGPNDGFAFRVSEHDQIGMAHVRMTQTYAGLAVVGGELIVHLSADHVAGINGRFVADIDLDTHVTVSDRRAADAALAYVESLGGRFGSVRSIDEPVIFAMEDAARLAVPVLVDYVDDHGPEMDMVYVDGRSGAPIARYARVYRAKFRKIYNANQACISTGNELPGTLMFQEGGSSADAAAMGAYNGTGITYDYYSTVHGRNSYDNAGANLVSSVHAQFSTGTSCDKNNAAWFDSPQDQMAYGDGDGSTFSNLANGLDVTAHELSHAVCSRTANLAYQKESGALNEANSDIMGRTAAFWSGQGNAATRTDWAIGMDVYTPGTSGDALRYMYNPTADGYSKDYYPTRLYSGTCSPSQSNDECGVHGNSGIANLFYYL
ncbi:MAG TPA: M4 family metallopeptidase, partial [Thermoanaerobaculia bacterium]|nr:M4 family metallopeptidase [Thermoanaerobaculia bacterium]